MWLNIPKYFTSDLQSSLTWSFQCTVSSSVRPRYLNELTLFIVIDPTLISSKFLCIGLLIVWKRIKFFSALIVNLLLLHHFIKCLNFVLMSQKSCVKFVCDINSAVSSANNLKFSGPTAFWISLIYIVKNNGPRTEPCGTPHSVFPNDDLASFITIYCCLLVR